MKFDFSGKNYISNWKIKKNFNFDLGMKLIDDELIELIKKQEMKNNVILDLSGKSFF